VKSVGSTKQPHARRAGVARESSPAATGVEESLRPAALTTQVAVVLPSVSAPAWVQELLLAIERSGAGRVAFVVIAKPSPRPLLYALYAWLDHLIFRERVLGAASEAVTDTFPHTQAMSVDEIARASSFPDVVIDLAGGSSADRLAARARFGVWTIEFGRTRVTPDAPTFFSELKEGATFTRILVRAVRGSSDPGTIVYLCNASTHPISLARNRSAAVQKLIYHLPRRLRALSETGLVEGRQAPIPPPEPITFPRGVTVVRQMWSVFGRALGRQLERRSKRERWVIAYRKAEPGAAMGGSKAQWRVLDTPRGRSYMDPVLFELRGRVYLFFEDFCHREQKAAIDYLELADDGTTSGPRVALRHAHHVSYPFVFAYEGSIFMIPETHGLRKVELYRADPFPDVWKLDRVLIDDIAASDATLLEHEGRLWLFVNVAVDVDGKAYTDELFLFWSESLSGPWREHPGNPVVADARFARPAGPIFARENRLYRPAQDCAGRYGAAVIFNRIERLTPTEYVETPCARLDNCWLAGNIGTHTYAAAGSWETIDGRTLAPQIWKGRG
jgi:hypothetical protein